MQTWSTCNSVFILTSHSYPVSYIVDTNDSDDALWTVCSQVVTDNVWKGLQGLFSNHQDVSCENLTHNNFTYKVVVQYNVPQWPDTPSFARKIVNVFHRIETPEMKLFNFVQIIRLITVIANSTWWIQTYLGSNQVGLLPSLYHQPWNPKPIK